MNYFLVHPDSRIEQLDKALSGSSLDPEFSQFVRREALGEALQGDNASPAYLKAAHRLGFQWEPNADQGHVEYDYRANLMRRLVFDYARKLVHGIGFPVYEVAGANMFRMDYPVVESYAALYGDRLYRFASGDNEVVMSYDASYPQFNLASKYPLSYRNLPFAHFSLADCYRHEQSGELMMLLRQRRFFMPDLHPYFRDLDEAFSWFPALARQIEAGGEAASRRYHVVIEVPSRRVFDDNREFIAGIPAALGRPVLVHLLEDGVSRYWIVNADFMILDALGQSREIGCVQIDVENARRLGISYADANGEGKAPVIIHAAIPGGIERYLYMVLDGLPSPGIPSWLQPVQLRLLPVGAAFNDACGALVRECSPLPVRIEIDDRNLRLEKKIRQAHEDLVKNIEVIGAIEMEDGLEKARSKIREIADAGKEMPFIRREWPAEMSRQLLP